MPTYLEPIGVPQWAQGERPRREQFNKAFEDLNKAYAGINTDALTRAESAAASAVQNAESSAASAREAREIAAATELQFQVDGDRFGLKRPGDTEFEWTDHLTGPAGPTGKPLRIAGRFNIVDELTAAYPDGDGDNSYLVGQRIYIYASGIWQETDIGGAAGTVNKQSPDAKGNIELTAEHIPVEVVGMDAGTVQEAVRILKKDGDEVREYFTPEGAAKNALFAANAQKLGGFLANEYNRALSFNPTIYVDAANGNDTTGDGSEAKPYATISKALYSLPKNLGGNTAIIKVADGTYDGLWIDKYFNGSLQIDAVTPEKDRVKITGQIMCFICSCAISLSGLTSVCKAESCFDAQSSTSLALGNCWATESAPDTIGINAAYGSRIIVNTVEISNKKIGANIDYAASLSSHMLTGSGNGIGVNCFSAIVYTSGSITGTTHRQVNYGQIFG